MTRLQWDQVSERFFETGVDRGVLYLPESAGVPWPGLISVEAGGDATTVESYYQDGVKYLDHVLRYDFQAKLEAFSAPPEFNACDGVVPIHRGLYATNQFRSDFGLSWRTGVGNDVDGVDHSYKIHLVYNAMAVTPSRAHKTLSRTPSPSKLTWEIQTIPELSTTHLPTAHYIISAKSLDESTLTALEDKLYGTDTTDPELPTPAALVSLITSGGAP